MKLGEDEQKIAEYHFKAAGDTSNMSTLTNRRLVVLYRDAEESYPLSKITAVKIAYKPLWAVVILGVLCIILALVLFSKSSAALLMSGNASTPVALLTLASGAGLVYYGFQGRTNLFISQMGGHKHYSVRGRDAALGTFIEALNSKLS